MVRSLQKAPCETVHKWVQNGLSAALLAAEDSQFQEKVKRLTCNGRPNLWRLLTDNKMPVLPAFYHVITVALPWWLADIVQRRLVTANLNLNFKFLRDWQTPSTQNCLF